MMLPWLFISGIKSVLLTFLETLTGVYVCSTFGKIRKPCVEFVASKAIELFFAIYLWACIRSIHKDLELYEENLREEELLTRMVVHRVNVRRRRARSMVDETTLYKTANLNYFELKDVPNIIFDMLKTEEELSQDSLLSPGMMLASVSNMGSYDYLKTSASLGELGFIDLETFQVVGLDDDRNLSPPMRAMKFLKITWEDIREARERTRRDSFAKNYVALKEIPKNIADAKPSVMLAKHQREEEVFFTEFPDLENIREEELRRKRSQMRAKEELLSSSREFDKKEVTREPSENVIEAEDGDGSDNLDEKNGGAAIEDEGEKSPNLWYMTNRKDEVSRIGLYEPRRERRSDNYARLYKEDFMGVIGPEVFDRASKPTPTVPDDGDEDGNGNEESPASDLPPARERPRKRIAFNEKYEEHTAMPLSVIVTNFPVRLTADVPKCETVYFRNTAEILLVPDSAQGSTFKTFSEASIINEMVAEGGGVPALNGLVNYTTEDTGPAASPERLYSPRSVNFVVVNCAAGTGSEGSLHPSACSAGPSGTGRYSAGGATNPSLPFCTPEDGASKFPVVKSSQLSGLLYENLSNCSGRADVQCVSEQISFVKDLMTKPIREVLKSYYDLRELNGESSRLNLPERVSSNESITSPRDLTARKSRWRLDALERIMAAASAAQGCFSGRRSLACVESEEKGSLANSVKFVDRETQPSDGDNADSRIGTETVRLGSPKTEKLKTNGNNLLPPLYLFGNTELGWSSSPLDVSTASLNEDGAKGKCRGQRINRVDVKNAKAVPVDKRVKTFGDDAKEANEKCTEKKSSVKASRTKPLIIPNHERERGKKMKSGMRVVDQGGEATAKRQAGSTPVRPSATNHGHFFIRKNVGGRLREDSFYSARESIVSAEVTRCPGNEDSRSICSIESDESFSLFYSKTADLASPLLDTKRFIYPDHIHYSYKNVKKKGFDVELNKGLPLLVRDSLTLNQSMTVKRIETPPDPQRGITRRPMDLTFAALTNVFSETNKSSCPSRRRTTNRPGYSERKRQNKTSASKVRMRDLDPTRNVDSEDSSSVRDVSVVSNLLQGITQDTSMKKEQKWFKKFSKERSRDEGVAKSNLSHLHPCKKGEAVSNVGPSAFPDVKEKKGKKMTQKTRVKNAKSNICNGNALPKKDFNKG